MSKFSDGYDPKWNPASQDVEWAQYLALEFPLLTEALVGDPKPEGGGVARPPLTLMIFGKEGTLRYSLSSRLTARAWFGSVKDPAKVLESVEASLAAGDGEWVTKRDDRR